LVSTGDKLRFLKSDIGDSSSISFLEDSSSSSSSVSSCLRRLASLAALRASFSFIRRSFKNLR
jgi:hypothetical protein